MKYQIRTSILFKILLIQGFSATFLILSSNFSAAQNIENQNGDLTNDILNLNYIVELLENGIDENSITEEIEETIEHYQKLRKNPLNINSASRYELSCLRVLSEFQILALKEHIRASGAILSYSELELVYGFNSNIVEFLKPYIFFGNAEVVRKGFLKDSKIALYTKYYTNLQNNSQTSGTPETKNASINKIGSVNSGSEKEKKGNREYRYSDDYFLLKYNLQYLNRLEIEFIMEKDSGEPYMGKNKIPAGDFISGAAALYDKHLGKVCIESIILGDMKVSFGQGLTLCNTSSFGGASVINGFMKNRESIGVYTSTNESNYLRGIGSTLSYKRLKISSVVSYKGVDATLNSDGSYKSIKTDGLHTSQNLIAAQNSMNEFVTGLYATLTLKKIKMGCSYCGYTYTKKCGTEPKYYNHKRLYNGYHQNISADFYTVLYGIRLFGEAAYSGSGSIAALIGANMTVRNSNIYLLVRHYPPNYIAPHSGAHSTLSYVANQEEITLAANGTIQKKYYYEINASASYYPYYRYNIKASSSNMKFSCKIGWSDKDFFSAAHNDFNFTFSYRNTTKYLSKGVDISEIRCYRWFGKLSLCKWANISCRGEYNSFGSIGLSSFLNIATINQRFKANIGATLYNAPNWNGRIYLYEQDLPQTFSSTAFYGRGSKCSALISYRFSLYNSSKRESATISTHLKVSVHTNQKAKENSTVSLRAGVQLSF